LSSANPADHADDLADHRQFAQAQLALDNDTLDNLQIELARLAGNQQQQLQQAFEQHRGIESQAASLAENTDTAPLETPQALRTMLGKIRAFAARARLRRD
jgi:hypothetical protein